MVVSGRQLVDDLLGLPLQAEFMRQEIAQADRRAQKERERVARLVQAEQDRRISTIEEKASSVLGELAQQWLLSANAQLDGKAPVDLATQSDNGLARAASELGDCTTNGAKPKPERLRDCVSKPHWRKIERS
jgi:uncharacterized protein (DUF2384 family)